MAVMVAIFFMVVGQGMGMVGKFGRKLRNICCCRKNNSPKSMTAASRVSSAIDYSREEKRKTDKFFPNPRAKKTKSRDDDDDPYGDVDYANVDYNASEMDESENNSMKVIQLQSKGMDIAMQDIYGPDFE